MRILRVLTSHRQPQSLAQLSLELGLHKPTLVRLLRTLMTEGVVVQDVDTKRYARNPAGMVRLAAFASPLLDFADAAKGILDELAARTGATAALFCPDRTSRTCTATMMSLPHTAVRLDLSERPPEPLHALASGKCYLAHLSEQQLEDYIRPGLESMTPRTITSPSRLRKELRRIREQGYALNNKEATMQSAGVAVPLRAASGEVKGALALAYADVFPPRADTSQLVAHLQQSADAISALLSYEWWLSRVRASAWRRPKGIPLPDTPDPGFGDGPLPAVRSVARAMRLIELLLVVPEGLTAGEAARIRALPEPAARRLLRTLEQEGIVARDAPGRGYRPDPLGFLPIARFLRSAAVLSELTRAVLQELVDATGAVARITVADATGRWPMDLQVVHPSGPVRLSADEETFPPLHATAGGKCCLAAQSRASIESYLQDGLSSRTPKTIKSPQQLRRELALVRERGYALNLEESDLGIGAVAVPLSTPDNAVVGAVALTAVIQDFTEVNIRRWLPLLRSAAGAISRLLVPGWQERIADGLP